MTLLVIGSNDSYSGVYPQSHYYGDRGWRTVGPCRSVWASYSETLPQRGTGRQYIALTIGKLLVFPLYSLITSICQKKKISGHLLPRETWFSGGGGESPKLRFKGN